MSKFSTITDGSFGKSSSIVAGLLTMFFLPLLARPAVAQTFYEQTNLVTDNQEALKEEGFAPAAFTDANLINPVLLQTFSKDKKSLTFSLFR